ncbi:MFS transporter [Corynebacterium aquilae]|uniref:MFS transporter n=1 Tax=Corynebacterium aquilae TaxID=203263 RepID=UPI001FE4BAC0|nr:MFS transporter [Corynebacterium aquilae]
MVDSAPAPARQATQAAPRVPRQTDISERRRTIVMLALALGGFGIGITEFVSMGLLSMIADDFGISEDRAGNIIAAYAMGVVVGAPLVATLTGHIPRRRLVIVLMAAFVVGNGLSALAHSYHLLLGARFLAGLPHGAYFSVAGLSAASMAADGKRGRAIAFLGYGFAIATVAGVPAAQALGAHVGWQWAYALVTAIGVVTFVSLVGLMPHMVRMKPTSPITELKAFTRPQVLLTLAVGVVGFGGMFAVYTYISWTMTEHAGVPERLMWVVLMAYGVGMLIGNGLGGRLSDRNVEFAIAFALVMIVVTLVSFYFTSAHPWLGTINFGLIGMFGSTLVPALQIRLMDTAGDAQTLAAALNHSALNLANAGGAALGGAVIARGFGYQAPALAGAAMAAVAIMVFVPASLARRRAERAGR